VHFREPVNEHRLARYGGLPWQARAPAAVYSTGVIASGLAGDILRLLDILAPSFATDRAVNPLRGG
jgi:hypothetical protein